MVIIYLNYSAFTSVFFLIHGSIIHIQITRASNLFTFPFGKLVGWAENWTVNYERDFIIVRRQTVHMSNGTSVGNYSNASSVE